MDILSMWIAQFVLGAKNMTRSSGSGDASNVGVSVTFRQRVDVRGAVPQTVTPSMIRSLPLGASFMENQETALNNLAQSAKVSA